MQSLVDLALMSTDD